MILSEIYMFASKSMECKGHVKLIIFFKKKSRKEKRNLDSHKILQINLQKSILPTAVIEMTIPFNH
jgi:hypothetical protein